jgi:hypothetical protein
MSKALRRKFKIINLRGCNGSGKSFIVRQLMEKTGAKPIYGKPKPGQFIGRINGYKGIYKGTPIFFLGSYEVMSGGCDAILKHDDILLVCDLVREFSKEGHVVFEGFLLTGIFQRFHDLSQELGGIIFCFMDTPLKKCLARIKRRNEEKGVVLGKTRGSMGTKHVAQKIYEGERTMKKLKAHGEQIVIIDHKNPMKAVYKLINS